MQTMDSLPQIPQAQMQSIMKDFKKIDESLAAQAPGDIITELTPQQEAPQQEYTEQAEQQSAPHEEQKESPENRSNIRYLREKADRAERAERERDELLMRLRDMERNSPSSQQAQQALNEIAEENFSLDLAPDALAEGKHVAKIYKKMQAMENQLKRYQQQTSQNIMEAQIKAQFPDFDLVVSRANVEELRRSHPAIAQTLAAAASSDAYSAAASAYSIIKEMGIAKSMQESQMTRKILQENASKPRSAQAAAPQRGSTPLSKANEYMADGKMTPELQTQLLREMNDARRQARR
jgi:hypothetical protein